MNIFTRVWEITHNNHQIKVTNSPLAEKLYVDDQLQDHSMGIGFKEVLFGHITDGDKKHEIKVRIGGTLSITCNIFIDNTPIMIKGRELNKA